MKKISLFVIAVFALSLFSQLLTSQTKISAQGQEFTAAELAEYDGKDGRKSYTSYEGVVYDVTDSKLWKLGEHFGLEAGKDLTADMADAPHGDEVFAGFTVVGTTDISAPSGEETVEAVSTTKSNLAPQKWWQGRIKIFGFSVLGWTGLLMGIFFVLTFATCFAMPWAKLPVPWRGLKPGPDPLDKSPRHMPWSSVHKYFVWWTVALGVIHGVLGTMQMFGFYL